MKVPSGKIPLKYQSTEYDCVPTTFLNALNFLFKRDEIPPEVVQRILLYSLDTINKKGEHGKGGTTGLSANFLIQWLNAYSNAGAKNFKLDCEYLSGDYDEINLGKNNKIIRCINKGGVALFSVCIDKDLLHYVLCTEADSRFLCFFDPYFRQKQFSSKEREHCEWVTGEWKYNLKVSRQRVDSLGHERYSLGPFREVCLINRVF
jgi:hypothetical protein